MPSRRWPSLSATKLWTATCGAWPPLLWAWSPSFAHGRRCSAHRCRRSRIFAIGQRFVAAVQRCAPLSRTARSCPELRRCCLALRAVVRRFVAAVWMAYIYINQNQLHMNEPTECSVGGVPKFILLQLLDHDLTETPSGEVRVLELVATFVLGHLELGKYPAVISWVNPDGHPDCVFRIPRLRDAAPSYLHHQRADVPAQLSRRSGQAFVHR